NNGSRFTVLGLSRRIRLRRVRPELARVALGELSDDLVVEIVEVLAHLFGDALREDLGAAVDVLLETRVEIGLLAALLDSGLVVKLDLRDEEPRQATGVLVPLVGLFELRRRRRGAGDGRPGRRFRRRRWSRRRRWRGLDLGLRRRRWRRL